MPSQIMWAKEPTIISLETRLDGLVLQLADSPQILAVRQRTQKQCNSVFWKQAEEITGLRREMGEEIYSLKPDIVFFGQWSDRNTQKMLKGLGIEVERPTDPRSWEELWKEIAHVGKLVGHPQRAKELIDKMQKRLQCIEETTSTLSHKRAIYYVGSGVTRGGKTLLDSMLKSAGLINVATEAGITGMGRMGVEELTLLKPDMIVFTDYNKDTPTMSRQLLEHPIFDKLSKKTIIVELHASKLNSPGMPYIDCVEQLARAAHPEAFSAIAKK